MKLHLDKQIHISLSSFICWSVVFRVIVDWVKIISRGISLQPQVKKLEHTKLYWPLIENDWKNSLYGISAIRNVLFFNLFEEALEYLKTQKVMHLSYGKSRMGNRSFTSVEK